MPVEKQGQKACGPNTYVLLALGLAAGGISALSGGAALRLYGDVGDTGERPVVAGLGGAQQLHVALQVLKALDQTAIVLHQLLVVRPLRLKLS